MTARARAPSLTAFVDTNVLIRHLTGDPPEMAARATAVLAAGEELLLAAIALPSIRVTDEPSLPAHARGLRA
jgi:predicted nucleic acid-binding protein